MCDAAPGSADDVIELMKRLAASPSRASGPASVRALATTVAVVVGVAFVAGTYVLTDTINAAFDEIFSDSLKGTCVVVTAKNPVEQENGEIPTIQASLLPKVQRVPGVNLAAGAIFTPGGFFDADGDKIGNKFAPKFISSHCPTGSRR